MRYSTASRSPGVARFAALCVRLLCWQKFTSSLRRDNGHGHSHARQSNPADFCDYAASCARACLPKNLNAQGDKRPILVFTDGAWKVEGPAWMLWLWIQSQISALFGLEPCLKRS